MIDLQAIALRRAEEQSRGFRWVEEAPKLRIVRDKSRGGRQLVCACGECRRCKNRQSMREARARGPHAAPRKRGRKMSDVLCSVCHEHPIAVLNKTGICTDCHRHRARRIGRVALSPQHYSHGGGI